MFKILTQGLTVPALNKTIHTILDHVSSDEGAIINWELNTPYTEPLKNISATANSIHDIFTVIKNKSLTDNIVNEDWEIRFHNHDGYVTVTPERVTAEYSVDTYCISTGLVRDICRIKVNTTLGT